jgi:hypothetical protein
MLRRVLGGIVVVGILASFIGLGAPSMFAASTANDGNTFTTGSLDISTSPASAFLSMSSMAPGDSVTAQLTVTNGGTLELRYAMTASATNTDSLNLRDALTLTIKTLGANCATAARRPDHRE